ncbi:hypothetical protein LZK73_12050 [Neorhizobium galegae]|nr:hypothetical protein LZK73_12050 [Neorhizobium galegae]
MVRDRHNDQLGLMYDLGKVEAQIADLENRVHEQDERGEEQRAAQEWQAELPVAQEDHLDWLRPVLDAPEPAVEHGRDERHPHYEGGRADAAGDAARGSGARRLSGLVEEMSCL